MRGGGGIHMYNLKFVNLYVNTKNIYIRLHKGLN